MDEVFKVVLELVAAIGGIGAIFTAAVGFSSAFIAEKLQKKYQLKLNEELEKYKAGLTNKVYISKTKFDAEFEIYRRLSEVFSKCVKAFNILIPSGLTSVPADEAKRKELEEKNHREAVNAYVAAQDELSRSIPFISQDIVDKYESLLKLCSMQLWDFEERWNMSFIGSEKEKSTLSTENYKRTTKINDEFIEINTNIREYLARLDVL